MWPRIKRPDASGFSARAYGFDSGERLPGPVLESWLGDGRLDTAVRNMARKVTALCLSMGERLYWCYVRAHRNHADAPSRNRPFGAPRAGRRCAVACGRVPSGALLPPYPRLKRCFGRCRGFDGGGASGSIQGVA